MIDGANGLESSEGREKRRIYLLDGWAKRDAQQDKKRGRGPGMIKKRRELGKIMGK